jgi:hypothetical protein
MQKIGYELITLFAVGLFLLIVVGVQCYFGKVYTRGREGFQWHNKSFVSRGEAPLIFWSIIGLQSIIGLALVAASIVEVYARLH